MAFPVCKKIGLYFGEDPTTHPSMGMIFSERGVKSNVYISTVHESDRNRGKIRSKSDN